MSAKLRNTVALCFTCLHDVHGCVGKVVSASNDHARGSLLFCGCGIVKDSHTLWCDVVRFKVGKSRDIWMCSLAVVT